MKCTSDENVDGVFTLIVASACGIKSARWQEGVLGLADLHHIDNLDRLRNEIARISPEILLLDHSLPGLDGARGVSGLRKLCPGTKIVIFNDTSTEDEEWAMFKAGVRGCCAADIKPSSLRMMVNAVRNGELWIRRTLTRRLLEQLERLEEKVDSNQVAVSYDALSLLEKLTEREYEIAVKVASGESNKEIARALEITERTVKAHLSKVFNKLGVADRLKVALILSADKRRERRTTQKSKHKGSAFQGANI